MPMSDKSIPAPEPIPQAAARPPQFIMLESDCGPWLAGSVLRADAELLETLDARGASFREATEAERRIAGVL
jgi:hypothetical protein